MAKAKPIFIPGTNMQFTSASAAAKSLGINAGNIYSVLAGRRKTAGGYQFGYAENRTIYIQETGQSFSNIKDAARAVKVSTKKAIKGLEGRSGSAIGGYHFTYADKTKVSPVSASDSLASKQQQRPKRARKQNKQERIQQKRQKKQAAQTRRQQKEAERRQERAKASHRQQQRYKERQQQLKLRPYIDNYNVAKSELQEYLNKVNDKIAEYYNTNSALIYYAPTSPDVLGMQMVIGYTDDGYFDPSLSEFTLPENPTQEEIEKLFERLKNMKKRMEMETSKKNSAFWDLNIAEQTRRDIALEFFKVPGHEDEMDKYAYMLWDIIDILNRAHEFPDELGSDIVFTSIQDAMHGNIPAYKLEEFLDGLSGWMDGGSAQELDEILSGLDGYEPQPGFSVWDDEEWTIL